jgi:pimeloyl-ACP methyl ester carboxylesterase
MKRILFLLFLPLNLLAIDPDRNYDLTPDSIDWEYEELVITTEDGYDLNTWIYAPNPDIQKDKLLILAYPDAGNMSYFVLQASILANLGYTVVTFDYRGFGKSSDFKIEPNNLFHTEFSKDLEAVVDFAKGRFQNKSLGIWACSMGTMVTTYAYDVIKDKINFLIFDAVVFNPREHIERLKSQKNKQTFSPVNTEEFVLKWKSIVIPVLLFAGKDDEVTTVEDANAYQDEFDVKPTIKIYDGGHLMGFQHDIRNSGFGGWYSSQIDLFIKEIR